jgi:hypothetical protein
MPCKEPGCPNNVLDGTYCPQHVSNNQVKEYDRTRGKYDPNRKLYWSARYRRFRELLLVRNPVCQRIVNGMRCKNPSGVLHHLIDPTVAPQLFLTASNAVMLCEHCHPGGTAGTPDWICGRDYVETFSGFGVLGQSSSGQQF